MPKLNQLLSEKKVFRDPIHSYVNVEYQIIWDLINTKELPDARISELLEEKNRIRNVLWTQENYY